MIENLNKPIILITSDGDRDVPSTYDKKLVKKILSNTKIIKWYTQNYDGSLVHPKLSYYPIGLDMHTQKWLYFSNFDQFKSQEVLRNNKFNYFLKIRDQTTNKKNKVLCDSHLSISHPRRKEMFEILKHNKMVDFLKQTVDPLQIMKKYAEYRFVLSPKGNGLDCHRTWEIFLLGSIVITEKSSLDDMYIKNNLPVIILNNFNQLNDMNYNELEMLWDKNKHKCNKDNILDKFNTNYWVKELR